MASLLLAVTWLVAPSPVLAQQGAELQRLLSRLLATPPLKAGDGFTVRLLIPPGELYDPLFMIPQGTSALLSDDGGVKSGKQSRLLSVDPQGKITVLADIGTVDLLIGIGIAPPSYGANAGQIYSLSQAVPLMEGVTRNHIIQRLDPKRGYAGTTVCTLPNANPTRVPAKAPAEADAIPAAASMDARAKGVPGTGIDARFGPNGTPFADKFFSVTGLNSTIYQTTANGTCTPFVSFSGRLSGPGTITFTPDGKHMLVSVLRGDVGAVARVTPDGKIEETLFAEGFVRPLGLAFAPPGFGSYGGNLFVTDTGRPSGVSVREPSGTNGSIYRITPDGQRHLVASGFSTPVGLSFFDGKLWVTAINTDYIAGRELPDGYLAEIRPR
jgi:hypothetical protein